MSETRTPEQIAERDARLGKLARAIARALRKRSDELKIDTERDTCVQLAEMLDEVFHESEYPEVGPR